jgi:hypothetical protein
MSKKSQDLSFSHSQSGQLLLLQAALSSFYAFTPFCGIDIHSEINW